MIANQPIKLAETSTRQVAKLATGHLVAGPVELLFIQLLRGSPPLTFLPWWGKCAQFSHGCQHSTLGVKNSVHYIASKFFTPTALSEQHHLLHSPWPLTFMRPATLLWSKASCILHVLPTFPCKMCQPTVSKTGQALAIFVSCSVIAL